MQRIADTFSTNAFQTLQTDFKTSSSEEDQTVSFLSKLNDAYSEQERDTPPCLENSLQSKKIETKESDSSNTINNSTSKVEENKTVTEKVAESENASDNENESENLKTEKTKTKYSKVNVKLNKTKTSEKEKKIRSKEENTQTVKLENSGNYFTVYVQKNDTTVNKNIENIKNTNFVKKDAKITPKEIVLPNQLTWLKDIQEKDSRLYDKVEKLVKNAKVDIDASKEKNEITIDLAQDLSGTNIELQLSKIQKKNVTGNQSEASVEGDDGKNKKNIQEVKFTVRDLRTETIDSKNVLEASKKNAASKNNKSADTTIQIPVSTAQAAQQNLLSLDGQTTSATASNFQAMVQNQIQMNAPDIVKAGNIVLQNNNKGSIELILHPESLGNVKINLQLSDKVVTGHIIVHSADAYKALTQSADSLKQAFLQSGFDVSGFDVSFAGQNASGGYNQSNSSNNNNDKNYRGSKMYSEYSSEEISSGNDSDALNNLIDNHGINIVA